MEEQDYATVIKTPKTTNKAFMAIKNIQGWWTENFEGKTQKIGDEFKVVFGDTFIKLKLVEQLTNYKLVWEVVDGYKHFLKDKREWVGTKLHFDIANRDNAETEITFTHEGLVRPLECYGICTDAWNGYLQGSLKQLIDTGKGNADKRE